MPTEPERTPQLTEHTAWDNRQRDSMSRGEMLEIIANAETTVFVRLRSDGHPVGAVVGSAVLDGEIFTFTNLFRAAYKNVLRDERCSAVFDIPDTASVTVIGRAEIVADPELIERFVVSMATRHWAVTSGAISVEDFTKMANTPNRRLIRIHPEKFFSTDQRTLVP